MRSFLIVSALLGWGATCNAQPVAKQKIYFGRLGQPDISLYISDGDGRHEHLLVPPSRAGIFAVFLSRWAVDRLHAGVRWTSGYLSRASGRERIATANERSRLR